MEGADDVGVDVVVFGATSAELHDARAGQRLAIRLRVGEGGGMLREDVLGQIFEAQPAELAHRPRQAEVDDVVAKAECLEDLGAPVGVDRRDPHLRHDLQHAVFERGAVALLRVAARELVAPADAALVGEVGERLEGELGDDRVRPVAEQAGHVVGDPCLVRLGHYARVGAQPLSQQALVGSPHREQYRDARPQLVAAHVADDDDSASPVDGVHHLVPEPEQCRFHASWSFGHRKGRIDRRHRPRDVGIEHEALQPVGVEQE